jgi:hypothetical protein
MHRNNHRSLEPLFSSVIITLYTLTNSSRKSTSLSNKQFATRSYEFHLKNFLKRTTREL